MASFQVEWKRSAEKELEKLPKQVIAKVLTAVGELSNDPFPHGVRKLVGSEHSYRVRLGDANCLRCFPIQIVD